MKNLYLLLLFTGIVNAQVVIIADANFKATLLAADPTNHIAKDITGVYIKIDTNCNGQIEQSEALAVYDLNISSSNIASLDGIEKFTTLEYLNCTYNPLTVLPISSLINLNVLDCNHTQLLSLDTSMLPNLAFISFGNPSLNSVRLSSNLYHISCYGGSFTSLDTSNFLNLWRFGCFNTNITSLDFSTAPNLLHLQCSDNNLLAYINLKNGSYGKGNISLLNNRNLTSVCADAREVSTFQDYFTNTGQTGITVNSNCSLGTQDILAAALKIYPNPTTGIIHITATNNLKLVEIYDLQGRLLQTNTANASTTAIDISARAAGIYLLKVQTANGVRTEKIVKQ